MSSGFADERELKRKLRKLKQLELRIRFGQSDLSNGKQEHTNKKVPGLIWDEFFDLHEVSKRQVKYPLSRLIVMDKEEYKGIVDEYFFHVYFHMYKDKGGVEVNLYNPELLEQLDLPYDADNTAIKRRFRELAKKYHPDTGGDSAEFIRLVESFRELMNMGD